MLAKDGEMNECVFSPCRRYRYSLRHVWHSERPCVAWIGLNPSTADEQKLDPTLIRVRKFSNSWGCGSFVMLNLFAFRSPHPSEMKRAADPIGLQNNDVITRECLKAKFVVACWGLSGSYLGRDVEVKEMLSREGIRLRVLGETLDKHPKHPLARGIHRIPDCAVPIPI